MPTLSKSLPSPCKAATVLTHKRTSSPHLSCFYDLPRLPLAPKLVMESLIQYPHTLLITPLKGIQTRPSLHSALSSHTPPLSLSRAPATALVLTSAFLLFLQRHQRHLPRALSHTTALLRNLQQECPTTRHGSGFSAQSFMV